MWTLPVRVPLAPAQVWPEFGTLHLRAAVRGQTPPVPPVAPPPVHSIHREVEPGQAARARNRHDPLALLLRRVPGDSTRRRGAILPAQSTRRPACWWSL